MKTLFIEAKSDFDLDNSLKYIKLEGKVGLITTIQYLHKLKRLNKKLKNSIIGGQVLGCNVDNALKIMNKVDCFLYIGSGEFHPMYVALKTNKPTYCFNPVTNQFSKILDEDIKRIKKSEQGKLFCFLNAKKYGILVSLKLGQEHIKEALKLKSSLKNSYIFLFDTLNNEEFENFGDIDCWVNTACPRIECKKTINIKDLPNYKP